MDLNQQEKDKLLQKLREESARKKAEELGVDPSDIMLRVHDGKSSWVRKSEVYVQLDRQRKLVAPPKIMRSIRDGKNSLVARIHREVNQCRQLMSDLAKQKVPASINISEFKTSTAKLENRANSIENQLTDVEARIDRAKARDPIFAMAEAVFADVRSAQDQNDQERADRLLAENKDTLGKYEFLRKSLNPYLEEARKYRLELQKEYWQIMQSRFKLQAVSIQLVKSDLAPLLAHLQQDGSQSSLIKASELIKEDEQCQKKYLDLSSHTPPSHIPPQDACSVWDCILPEMESLLDQQVDLQNQFSDLMTGQKVPADSSKSRMAFVQKRR